MTHKTTITDNYILITSDEEIRSGDWQLDTKNKLSRFSTISMNLYGESYKKVIAHLPITDSADLRGVPLLPPLPSGEDDVEKMAKEYINDEWEKDDDAVKFGIKVGYGVGYNKAKEKYRFTEGNMMEAMLKICEYYADSVSSGGVLDGYKTAKEIIQSLSQPKIPIEFKCKMERKLLHSGFVDIVPKIINGVMQGEWIY